MRTVASVKPEAPAWLTARTRQAWSVSGGRSRTTRLSAFAPVVVNVPVGVSVRKVDLAIELQILAYYEQRRATLAEVKRRGRAVADVTGP